MPMLQLEEYDVTELFLDVRQGARADGLLGALIEAGASLEVVEAAVAALGSGEVRLQLQASATGASLRIHAPQDAPDQPSWRALRPRIELLALDEHVVALTMSLLDHLFAARGAVHDLPAEDMDIDPFSGLDDLADAVALAAATASLAVDRIRTSVVGHGRGVLSTIEGDVDLPGPVVSRLLVGLDTVVVDRRLELVDPVGAAYLHAVGHEQTDDVPELDRTTSHGRGRLPDGHTVWALVLGGPDEVAA